MSRVYVEAVEVGDRLRSIRQDRVKALAESMAEIGLLQPITIHSEEAPDGLGKVTLVAGLHRLEAARALGWQEIEAININLSDLDRQLAEIDENLMRADLTDAERAEHTAKRAEVVRQKELLANSAKKSAHRPNTGQTTFAKETAERTGRSERAVRLDKERGEKIDPAAMKELKGTRIAGSGVQLDALAKASPEDQRNAVAKVCLGEADDVRDVLGYREDDQTKVYNELCRWWKKADEATRQRFKKAWL